MLLYVTMSWWTPYIIYFWISILALCVAPFLFNPHQFVFSDFFIDYRYVHDRAFRPALFIFPSVNSYGGCPVETRAHTTTLGSGIAVYRER